MVGVCLGCPTLSMACTRTRKRKSSVPWCARAARRSSWRRRRPRRRRPAPVGVRAAVRARLVSALNVCVVHVFACSRSQAASRKHIHLASPSLAHPRIGRQLAQPLLPPRAPRRARCWHVHDVGVTVSCCLPAWPPLCTAHTGECPPRHANATFGPLARRAGPAAKHTGNAGAL